MRFETICYAQKFWWWVEREFPENRWGWKVSDYEAAFVLWAEEGKP